MVKTHRYWILLALLLFVAGIAEAQNNTNSPYTRYGYGELNNLGSANSRGMGGVSYGLRDKDYTNFVNPASYTSIDSLTFIFDGGLTLQNTNFSNGTLKTNAKNTSLDYLTMHFRFGKRLAMSMGLLPFSNVGYNFSKSSDTDTTNPYALTYAGDGGLHQLYGGLGFKILNNLSIGANFSYLWGGISHNLYQSFTENTQIMGFTRIDKLDVRSYKIDLGAQYTYEIGKNQSLTLGVVYTPGHDLNNSSTVEDILSNYDSSLSSSVTYSEVVRDTIVTCGIPDMLGIGIAYKYSDKLTLGLDATLAQWNEVTFMNSKSFVNSKKLAVGLEYIPNNLGRSYLSIIRYRLGGFYSKPYYTVNNATVKEYGVTAGFGLPIPQSRSILSISGQYVHTKGNAQNMLSQDMLRVCIGLTFNERWFFKRKI